MTFIERDTPEWHAAWARLQDAINNHRLPAEAGGTVRTTLADWVLMHQQDDGTVAFKHRDTRNYILIRPDGTLTVPTTARPFMRGRF